MSSPPNKGTPTPTPVPQKGIQASRTPLRATQAHYFSLSKSQHRSPKPCPQEVPMCPGTPKKGPKYPGSPKKGHHCLETPQNQDPGIKAHPGTADSTTPGLPWPSSR